MASGRSVQADSCADFTENVRAKSPGLVVNAEFTELCADDDEDFRIHILARAIAIAHYQLKGPLRMNFVRNYINKEIMEHVEIVAAAKRDSYLLMLTLAMAAVGTVMPWTYAAVTMHSKCPVSGVLHYTINPTHWGSCGCVSLWNMLFVPFALMMVKLWICLLEYVCTVHGRRFMIYIYRILDSAMPSLEPLKYHQTPTLYAYISQGTGLVLLQLLIESLLLQDVSALVTGYTVFQLFMHMVPKALAPPAATIGTLQCELQHWSDEPYAQQFFLRLLTHHDTFLVVSSIEFQALLAAVAENGSLQRLFEDAREQNLTFGLEGDGTKRHVHLTPLYLKSIHFPFDAEESADGQHRRSSFSQRVSTAACLVK